MTSRKMVTLVVSTTIDPASFGPASALLAMPTWSPGPVFEGVKSYVHEKGVRLLQHDKSIVVEDNLDSRWEEVTNESVDNVIFLSKHTAVSNRPALTIHPIGVPHLKEGDAAPQGGKPGWASPPDPRMGPWMRLLKKIAQSHNLIPEFEITMEATHHGPVTTKPTMFLEIGSTLEYWKRQDAAQVMASLIWEGLGLGGDAAVGEWDRTLGLLPVPFRMEPKTCYSLVPDYDGIKQNGTKMSIALLLNVEWQSSDAIIDANFTGEADKRKVLLGLGGGHYVPRHMDIIMKENVWVGHLLSGYTLPMDDPDQSKSRTDAANVGGTWKDAIRASFEATKAAFPGGEILAHLDQKSFKGWQKNAINAFLQEQNIKIGKPADFN